MSQQQTSNAPTNADSRTPVSFSDVSLTQLKTFFSDTYKVSKGSASQVVLGFQAMSERLQEPSNEYQQVLYPKLKELCLRLSTKYVDTFLTTFGSDVERQVFGANLNGNRNNGSLYRSIPSGVNRNLTYNYAQFGQLTRVLTSRLRFIAQREASSVQRYRDSVDEGTTYETLRTRVNTFLSFLDELTTEWNTLVSDTRTRFNQPDSQQTNNSQVRQQRQTRFQGQQRREYVQGQRTSQTRQNHGQSGQNTSGQRVQYKSVRPRQNQPENGEWTTPRVTSRNTRQQTKSSVVV